jgi:hypothetical protein
MKSKIIFLLLLLLPGAAFAQEESGTCGENLTWTYSNGTLTISGTGDMTDYKYYSSWYSYRSSIATVIIGNSVTSIGENAFEYCSSFASVTNMNPAPQSIWSIVFDGVNIGNVVLYVPAESVALYKAADVWQNFGTITALSPSAIDMPTATSAIRIYSNPATGSLRIEGLTVPAQVTVINTAGQTVWRQTVADGGSLSTAHLPRGVYLVHVNGQTMKIIK